MKRLFFLACVYSVFLGAVAVQAFHDPTGLCPILLYLYLLPRALLLPPVLLVLVSSLSRCARRSVRSVFVAAALLLILTPMVQLRCSSQSAFAEDCRLRVISLNAQSWGPNFPDVVKRTRALRPDILLLQEVWNIKQLEVFERGMPEMAFYVDDERSEGTGERGRLGTAVGTLRPLQVCSLISPNNSCAVELELDNGKITLISLHGRKKTNYTPSGLSSTLALQKEQSEEMEAFLRQLDTAVILGGDLNAPPHAPLTRMLSARLMDAFTQRDGYYGNTFPSRFPLVRLDHVFVSANAISVLGCRTADVGSDHLAVVAELAISSAR